MAQAGMTAAVVLEKLREFDRVASVLEMPSDERLGILNLSAEAYRGLRAGQVAAEYALKPELERRLSYALPLMRRLAGNSPMLRTRTASGLAA